jgi:outer membrane protein TolC
MPVTPATEARIEPDWDSSLAEMLESQPDVVQQKVLVRIAELQLLLARNQLLPRLSLNALDQLKTVGCRFDSPDAVFIGSALKALSPAINGAEAPSGVDPDPSSNNFLTKQVGVTCACPLGRQGYPFANARSAQYVLLRSRAYYQQVVHQTTHSLARFFLEIDANYKQLQTAKRLREAAAQRLDAQRAYYEEGRITIDRFLDSVSQYATAVATEAQYKATYNISIVALEEAKGTLLAYDNISVAEGPRPRKAYVRARDMRAEQRSSPIKPDEHVMAASVTAATPANAAVSPAKASCSGDSSQTATPAKAKTWTFSITIGGAKPLQIKGTITSSDAEPTAAAH